VRCAAVIEKRDAEKAMRQAEGQEPFKPNAFYERLIELRARRPEEFERLSPASRLALGFYEGAKRRASMLAET
jgi:hypothetical protein